jgi:ATP synthase protein I
MDLYSTQTEDNSNQILADPSKKCLRFCPATKNRDVHQKLRLTKGAPYDRKESGFEINMPLSDSKKDVVRSLISYSSLGLEMGLSVAIGLGIGYFLDTYFKTYPYLTLVFMFFGIAASMKALYMAWRKAQREDKE